MKNHTTFKIGGPAEALVIPGTDREIVEAVAQCRRLGAPYYIIGNGSNLLVADAGVRGVVIKLYKNFSKVTFSGTSITAEAGAGLAGIAALAAKNSLCGMEFASGIPGTVGGAVFMNAGAYGGEMKDVVVKTQYIDKNLEIKETEEHQFSYRKSVFQKNGGIIIRTTLRLSQGVQDEIYGKMKKLSAERNQKQPMDLPSAGSAFKRPRDGFAAKLIDEAGLRGYRVGGAMVSEKHTGFIVNTGGATAADVLELLEHVKKTVYGQAGIVLEPEIKYVE